MKLSVVVPVYNERDTVLEVLRRVRAAPLPVAREVVVVDDGSTDGTADLLRSLPESGDLRVHLSARNGGKGAAVRTGIGLATGDWLIIQDADLELDPAEHARLLEPALAGRAEVVYGSRFLGRPPLWTSVNYWANRSLTLATNLLFGCRLTDMETCYKLFPVGLLRRLRLTARGFDIEPELTACARRLGYRIVEVPVSYRPRTVREGKKLRWRDGVAALRMLVRRRLEPRSALAGDGAAS